MTRGVIVANIPAFILFFLYTDGVSLVLQFYVYLCSSVTLCFTLVFINYQSIVFLFLILYFSLIL